MPADQPSRVRMPSPPPPSARQTPDFGATDLDAAQAWARLDAALDAAAATGRSVDLWWRDDDAVAPNPALDRLLDLAAETAVPIALAIIPAHTGDELAAALDRRAGDGAETTALVHGWRHHNHAPDDAKQTEIGDHRPLDTVAAELVAGRERLAALFGPRALPVMVPPWNRIGASVMAALPDLGFIGVSGFGAEGAAPAPLVEANVQLDPIAWHDDRRYVGDARLLDDLVAEIAKGHGRPIGLMTHHWAHDDALWACLARLAGVIAAHPAARWRPAGAVFAGGPAAASAA